MFCAEYYTVSPDTFPQEYFVPAGYSKIYRQTDTGYYHKPGYHSGLPILFGSFLQAGHQQGLGPIAKPPFVASGVTIAFVPAVGY